MKILGNLEDYRYMQFLCVFTVTLLHGCLSMSSSWISPVLPQLTSNNTPLQAPLTKVEESWIVSGEKLGAVIGCVLAAFLTDKIGRKRILLLAAVPLSVSLISTAFNKIVSVLIILRVIAGISGGLCFVVSPVYIGEVSDKDIRGRLGVMQVLLSTLGSVYVYSVGPFVSFTALTVSCAVFPVIFLILFGFMPETPYHLIKNGNIESAINSLKQLSHKHVTNEAIDVRIQEIKDFIARDSENKVHLVDLLRNKLYRKPFLIALTLRSILSLSGIHVIAGYLQKIVQSTNSIVSPEVSSVIFGIIKVPSVLLAAVLVDKLGRRPLLVVSTIGCAISLTVEGLYFFFEERMNVADISWIPTTGLSLYLVSGYFGIDLLPAIIVGEFFTTNVKSLASASIVCFGYTLSFLLLQVFKPISDAAGVYTPFWFFGAYCVFGCVFAIFILPETKGKTFSEIQEILSENKQK